MLHLPTGPGAHGERGSVYSDARCDGDVFTSVLELFGQQQSGGQGEGHHEHGHVGGTQALLREPHQAAAPQQQAHVEVEVAQLHQAHALRGENTRRSGTS